jgi:parallel beta-helix repeat protein
MHELKHASLGAVLFGVVMLGTLWGGPQSQLMAATLCVNPGGTGGCFAKINDAVAAAAKNDTIQVAAGVYKEDVMIGKPLALVGAGSTSTIINAKGLANAIYVDGLDHAGLTNVVVTGFTTSNANFEGILVTNASHVTIASNRVVGNNQSLDVQNVTCPEIPPFETAEGFDCGEGIHLSGVHHSTVSGNVVVNNAGGILLSDDTAATHHNLITKNVVKNNPFDCGITLASHPPASNPATGMPLGVFSNTISGNTSANNGRAVGGAGAGVGIFDSVPGASNYGNVVVNNRLMDNGLPGVAMHSHAPNQNLNNNVIVGNFISGNGQDTDDTATPGKTGINVNNGFGGSPVAGTVISQNVIMNEDVGIAARTKGVVDVNLNQLLPSGMNVGIANLGSGQVQATENWWGCATGPGTAGCSTISGPSVAFTPWLTAPFK